MKQFNGERFIIVNSPILITVLDLLDGSEKVFASRKLADDWVEEQLDGGENLLTRYTSSLQSEFLLRHVTLTAMEQALEIDYDEDLVEKIQFITGLDSWQLQVAGVVVNYYEKFTNLARYVILNQDLFIRKLSAEDIKAYENGDDEYGDIVNWAERQLEMAENYDLEEDFDEWLQEEYRILQQLVTENL